MYLTLFHKFLILLVLGLIAGIYHLHQRLERNRKLELCKREAIRWKEREIKNLYRVIISTISGVRYETEPFLPETKIIDSNKPTLLKNTSLAIAERYVDTSVKNGFFKASRKGIPYSLIGKTEIVAITPVQPQVKNNNIPTFIHPHVVSHANN